jgi:hypothetical protein
MANIFKVMGGDCKNCVYCKAGTRGSPAQVIFKSAKDRPCVEVPARVADRASAPTEDPNHTDVIDPTLGLTRLRGAQAVAREGVNVWFPVVLMVGVVATVILAVAISVAVAPSVRDEKRAAQLAEARGALVLYAHIAETVAKDVLTRLDECYGFGIQARADVAACHRRVDEELRALQGDDGKSVTGVARGADPFLLNNSQKKESWLKLRRSPTRTSGTTP